MNIPASPCCPQHGLGSGARGPEPQDSAALEQPAAQPTGLHGAGGGDHGAEEGLDCVSSPPVHVITLPSLSAEQSPLQDASGHLSMVGQNLRALFSPGRKSCPGSVTLSFAALEEARLQLPFRVPAGLLVDRRMVSLSGKD